MEKYKLLSEVESTLEIREERFNHFQCEFCSRVLKSSEEARIHQVVVVPRYTDTSGS